MARLIVVAGASGAGKTFMLSQLTNYRNDIIPMGYARAKNKTIILTAKKGTELPFDVRQHRTNFYSNPIQLQKIVLEELKAYYQ